MLKLDIDQVCEGEWPRNPRRERSGVLAIISALSPRRCETSTTKPTEVYDSTPKSPAHLNRYIHAQRDRCVCAAGRNKCVCDFCSAGTSCGAPPPPVLMINLAPHLSALLNLLTLTADSHQPIIALNNFVSCPCRECTLPNLQCFWPLTTPHPHRVHHPLGPDEYRGSPRYWSRGVEQHLPYKHKRRAPNALRYPHHPRRVYIFRRSPFVKRNPTASGVVLFETFPTHEVQAVLAADTAYPHH